MITLEGTNSKTVQRRLYVAALSARVFTRRKQAAGRGWVGRAEQGELRSVLDRTGIAIVRNFRAVTKSDRRVI